MELQTLVKETTTTQGTGTVDLDGAATDFRAFATAFPSVTAGSGSAVVPYMIRAGSVLEEGQGTFTITGGGTHQLARDTQFASSNAGSLVDLGVGTKDVYLVIPATQVLVKDATHVIGDAASEYVFTAAAGKFRADEGGAGAADIWHQGLVTQTLATKGALTLPNGLALKWNKITVSANSSSSTDTFTTAFSTAFYVAVLGVEEAINQSSQSGLISFVRVGLTGIILHNGTADDHNITYVAVGV